MEHTILIRIGEIFLKGNNKRIFIALLKKNIIDSLSGMDYQLINAQNRMYIVDYDINTQEEIINRLSKVFGIFSLSSAIKIKTDIDNIANKCAEIFPKEGKFRVTVNRADKTLPKDSMEIARYIGKIMLTNSSKLSVDLFNYDFEVNVDIREDKNSYIFYKKIPCLGGMPIGCGGNGLLLLSGGIDSPVAGYMLAKRGVKIYAVHYHSFPYTSEQAKQKVLDLAKKMSIYCGSIEVYVVPFTEIQYVIKEKCPIEYMITIMRRYMMRIAEQLALKLDCGALITGESLGQVASQTMESIAVTNSVVSLPVYRPLIGMDKADIIEISKKIDTFNLSILPFEDCCTVFLPQNPVIKPKNKYALDYEKHLDSEKLIADAITNVEIIKCNYR